MDMERILVCVIDRIVKGETVPIKKEYQKVVGERLNTRRVSYKVTEKPTDANIVYFKRVARTC